MSAELNQTWQRVTAPGQVKVGTKIRFMLGDELRHETAKMILHAGTDKEEVIYNKRRNWYFITSMAMDGTGSQKNVEFRATAAASPALAQYVEHWCADRAFCKHHSHAAKPASPAQPAQQDSRAEFEAWAGVGAAQRHPTEDNRYFAADLDCAWMGWQAARSAPRPVLTEAGMWELAKQAGLAQHFQQAKRLICAVREGGGNV